MKFTYYGHSCFLLEISGKKLLFDPFITPNPLAAAIDVGAIAADYILISHGHHDHIADAVMFQQQTGATVIANWEICEWLKKQGIEQVHPMNIGGWRKFDFSGENIVGESVIIAMTTALHSSSFPDGSYAGCAGGFLIESEEEAFYYSGDTALTMDMKLIPEKFSHIDAAALPIGNNFTMDAFDAAKAAEFVRCDTVIGVHYNTFGYIEIDTERAAKEFSDRGKTLLLPAIGETLNL